MEEQTLAMLVLLSRTVDVAMSYQRRIDMDDHEKSNESMIRVHDREGSRSSSLMLFRKILGPAFAMNHRV